MDELLHMALDKLSRPTWRLEWRDYRVFECSIFWYIESAESSDSLPDDVARELLERGYVSQVNDDDPRDWRRTYAINGAGRGALAKANEQADILASMIMCPKCGGIGVTGSPPYVSDCDYCGGYGYTEAPR